MQKTKLFLNKNSAYFVGAGSLLDFAGALENNSFLAARRSRRRQDGQSIGQNWSKVGEDFRAATQELSRMTKG